MARMLVTGSSQGIGLETARQLIDLGHDVVAHARNDERAEATRAALPRAAAIVVGDLASLEQTRALAGAAQAEGPFEVVVHNAGVGDHAEPRPTRDGLEQIFQVNVLAPYLLTCLLPRPERLIYLSSGREAAGTWRPDDLQFERRAWDGRQAYDDSKLHDVMLALAVARHWPDTISNAVDPGWIRTRMGGTSAPDDLSEGAETQVWLATSDEPEATATGRYLKRRRVLDPNPVANDVEAQERLLAACAAMSGETLPD